MSTERTAIIKGYREFTKLIEKLNEEQLLKWLGGEMKLTLQEVVVKKAVNQENFQMLTVYKHELESMKSCEEANVYLEQLKLKKSQLKALALELSIHIKSSDNMTVMRQKIIEETIGSKLKMQILSNKNL